jgi:anti-sigma B factor antagonist
MKFTKKQIRPGVVVLEMTGSIRMGPNCQQIEQAVDEIIRGHETSAIFDLSGVSFIDSSGLGTVVKCLTRLKKLGGTLRLTGVKGMVKGVLELTQINRVIEIYPTAAEASGDLPLLSNP